MRHPRAKPLNGLKGLTPEDGRCGAGASPRQRVRLAVEKALREFPRSRARVVITGHSLGGGLAALCAFDLLACCQVLDRCLERSGSALTLLTFAGPRMFNRGFFDRLSALETSGRLCALRVVVGADVIPRLAPRWFGGWPPCRGRLLLHPLESSTAATTMNPGLGGAERGSGHISFDDEDMHDQVTWRILPTDAHVFHALYLAGESSAAHAPGDPREAAPTEKDWHTDEWPLFSPPAQVASCVTQ